MFGKRIIVVGHDLIAIVLAWYGAYLLRFNLEGIPAFDFEKGFLIFPVVFIVQTLVLWGLGLYRGIWRFASIPDLTRIFKAVVIGTVSSLFIIFLLGKLNGLPRSIFPIYSMLLVMILGGSRFGIRLLKDKNSLISTGKRVLVIGAGDAGEALVRDLFRGSGNEINPVAFVDDNPRRLNQEIRGIRVLGRVDDIPSLSVKHNIEKLIIALPSVSSVEMRRVVSLCEKTKLPFYTVPSLRDIISGKVSINQLREVSIEDLLGRESVKLNVSKLKDSFNKKVVLVTGAGGSIGSELCRQIANLSPETLVLVDNNEANLFYLEMELKEKYNHINIHIILANVCEKEAIEQVFLKFNPTIVYHAAAYKHVPMLEYQLREAVYNNVLGTNVVASCALEYKAQRFVLISSDKAVNPSNIMGLTKRIAEMICQSKSSDTNSHTKFMSVRFGNVLDSVGSVVPIFKEQIKKGGPVTVTHPEIQRYFMTIPEASMLVIQASILGKSGDTFVLDMGEPIKIKYLAEQMILLSGKTPYQDINIEFTGLRPGEKMYEELFYDIEELDKTSHPKILKAQFIAPLHDTLNDDLQNLINAAKVFDTSKVKEYLKEFSSKISNKVTLEALEDA